MKTIELHPHEADAMPGLRLIIRPVEIPFPDPRYPATEDHEPRDFRPLITKIVQHRDEHPNQWVPIVPAGEWPTPLTPPYLPHEEYRMYGAGAADQKDDSLHLHIFFRTIERVRCKRAKEITWQEALAWNCDPNCGQIALENLTSYLRYPLHPDDYDGNRWCWLFWLKET